jgi:hypothetical protein
MARFQGLDGGHGTAENDSQLLIKIVRGGGGHGVCLICFR